VRLSREEKSLTELCAEFEISRPTGYGWLKRYQEGGIAGMQEVSRRPHHSPERTPAEVEQRVGGVAAAAAGLGSAQIRHLLGRKASRCRRVRFIASFCGSSWCGTGIVSRWRCGASSGRTNQLWQMDFKGPKGWDQAVGPLSVLDDHSRYALALENTGSTQARGCTGRAGAGFPRQRSAGRNADGSRQALVHTQGRMAGVNLRCG